MFHQLSFKVSYWTDYITFNKKKNRKTKYKMIESTQECYCSCRHELCLFRIHIYSCWSENWYSWRLYQTSAAVYCGRIEPKGRKKIEVSKIITYEKLLRAKYYQVMHIWVISLINSYAIFRCGTYCHFESFSAILSFDKTLKVH